MNATNYRVNLSVSPLDFPPIMGLGESSVSYKTEDPQLIKNNILLTITMKYMLLEVNNNTEHEILAVQSVYEIPCNEIKNRVDVYEFYKDGIAVLNEAYQHARTELPALTRIGRKGLNENSPAKNARLSSSAPPTIQISNTFYSDLNLIYDLRSLFILNKTSNIGGMQILDVPRPDKRLYN